MSGIDQFLAGRDGSRTTRYTGTVVVASDGSLAVNVAGSVISALIVDPVVVAPGDSVIVDVVGGPRGQSAAWVIGRLSSVFRPPQGVVKTVPVGSTTITVTAGGADVVAGFVESYTPTVGDQVILSWDAAKPTVLGKTGSSAAAGSSEPGVAPPPPPPQTGTSSYSATASDTYWEPGGWGSWAGGGSHVYQGSYGSGPVTGAWFYGGATAELAGRTIKRIRFTLGPRRPVGASSSQVAVHIRTHTSANRPGGNVTFGSGSAVGDIPADPYQGAREYDLPLSFAPDLQAGGGIAIYGDPYAGFGGVLARADSGLLIIDWTR
jgi:hypothetical protein